MAITRHQRSASRRGAVLVLFAMLLFVLGAMAAFAIDIGWIGLARNQLQLAADAAAMAGAGELCSGTATSRDRVREYVNLNPVGGPNEYATLADEDIVFGLWNPTSGTFTPNPAGGNAVQITVRKRLPLFFARLLGWPHIDLEASAVGLANPRDVAFVIDLSASMSNDTEIWATDAINNAFPDYPGIGSDLIADVFEDFGYGAYPGVLKHVAQGLSGAPTGNSAYSWLANTYLLNNTSVPSKYKVLSTDSNATRKTKAYSWIIDYQLAQIMPAAMPAPSSATNLAYYTAYLDYMIKPYNSLPPNQNSYRLDNGGNPYSDAWPNLGSSSYSGFFNKLGYLTYVQFMMDYGRDKNVTGSVRVPLSQYSPYCPWNVNNDPASPGYGLTFPPREQPTHATRLAVMAAIDRIAEINAEVSDVAKDHVAIFTFDNIAGCAVRYPLSVSGCDYEAVKDSLRGLQAVAGGPASTASENGIVLARNHLDPALNPSGARLAARKLMIFLSDGIPNLKQSSSTTISNYKSAHPEGEWFTSGSYATERNAVLMQTSQLEAAGWRIFPVGVGLGADRELMDRMARMAGTGVRDPDNPNGPKISAYAEGNPADYEDLMTTIFNSIVSAPFVRLAQ